MMGRNSTRHAEAGSGSPWEGRATDAPENVLLVHNAYKLAGGEDAVFEDEAALLEEHGHRVSRFWMHNDAVDGIKPASLASKTLWNGEAYRALRAEIRASRPGVVHFHNTFPLMSPAAIHAAARERVPVVQTLHNYRLLCPNGLLFRDGGPCEDCLGRKLALPAVAHACYRGSRSATAAAAGMLAAHRVLGTYSKKVDAFIAPTEFARRRFVEGGLPGEKILVKPNFVSPDPGPGGGSGGYALFVGRLSEEKGIETLLAAWENHGGGGGLPLKIVGDGPLSGAVSRAAENANVDWLGRRTPQEVRRLMQEAAVLVLPSRVYETFGRVAAESFAAGTPVVASKLGAVGELVGHGRTGLHFEPGNAADLARQVGRLATNPRLLEWMRREARSEFEARYTAGFNYRLLAGIYARVARKVKA